MKKIAISLTLSLILFLVSCTKNIDQLNEDKKSATEVTPGSLFSNAQKNLVDEITSASVNQNVFRLLVQHWTETTYTDESNYDLITRNIPQNFWNIMYRDVLNNFSYAASLVPQQGPAVASEGVKKNQLAIIKIMQVYTNSVLVNSFGNIPYSQALKIDSTSTPKYDDAKTIYYSLLDNLDTAISSLNTSYGSFGSSDLLLGGDITSWKKFANSLKLRLGIIIADYDATKSKLIVESASSNVFSSVDDKVAFAYLSTPPNTNPIWVDLVQSGRYDFVGANTLIDTLKKTNDPRLSNFFDPISSGSFVGGIYGGGGNTASKNSLPSSKVTAANFESVLIDYAETEFLLSEAAARGYNISGTAASHYLNGVSASIGYWTGSTSSVATYLSDSRVDTSSFSTTWKQKIGYQKWVALYNRGFDAWTEWRRLDVPSLVAPTDAVSDIPVRLTYPANEQTLNGTNYKAAAAAIGGDLVTTKLFWDKN
jgi:hypothetical protein